MLFQNLHKQKDWTLALLVVDGHHCCELALGVGHGQWTCDVFWVFPVELSVCVPTL